MIDIPGMITCASTIMSHSYTLGWVFLMLINISDFVFVCIYYNTNLAFLLLYLSMVIVKHTKKCLAQHKFSNL